MKRELEMAREELCHTKDALKDISTKLRITQIQRNCTRKQTQEVCEKLEATIADHMHYEDELLEKNRFFAG